MSISDTAMAGCILPTDVMLSILTRLPAKSIQRFKFVSKLWRQLFSSPEFIKMYKGQFSIDPNNQSVIIFSGKAINLINIDSNNESPKKPSIIGLPCPRIVPVGCCNGLICMIFAGRDIIVLWNPALEMFQCLSLSEDAGRYRNGRFVSTLGLGYDAIRNDFKLLRIAYFFGEGFVILAEVYSVNSDAWTTIDVNLSFGIENGNSVVTVNGNPYWLAFTYNVVAYHNEEDDEPLYYNIKEDVLVYFDVKLLAFKIILLPPPYHHSDSKYKGFVDWNGTLGYLECAYNKEKMESYAKVWVFEEDRWRCKETLGPINGFVDSFDTCSKNGNILGSKDFKCFVYDRQSNCVEEIMAMERYYYFRICGYTPNLDRTLKKSLPQTANFECSSKKFLNK